MSRSRSGSSAMYANYFSSTPGRTPGSPDLPQRGDPSCVIFEGMNVVRTFLYCYCLSRFFLSVKSLAVTCHLGEDGNNCCVKLNHNQRYHIYFERIYACLYLCIYDTYRMEKCNRTHICLFVCMIRIIWRNATRTVMERCFTLTFFSSTGSSAA